MVFARSRHWASARTQLNKVKTDSHLVSPRYVLYHRSTWTCVSKVVVFDYSFLFSSHILMDAAFPRLLFIYCCYYYIHLTNKLFLLFKRILVKYNFVCLFC